MGPIKFQGLHMRQLLKIGPRKSKETSSAQAFSRTILVMDIGAENRGRPH